MKPGDTSVSGVHICTSATPAPGRGCVETKNGIRVNSMLLNSRSQNEKYRTYVHQIRSASLGFFNRCEFSHIWTHPRLQDDVLVILL